MNIFKITITSLLFLIVSFSVSIAQLDLLIAVDDVCVQNGGAGSENSTLYRVDPTTGQVLEIGPIGFSGVTGMAVLGDGRLVASAKGDVGDDKISILIEINPLTGQGTLIGTIGNNNQGGCGRAPDLSYNPANNTLYGIGFRCIPGGGHGNITELLTINQTTGQGSTVGQTGFFGGGNGLAFSPGLTLFSFPNEEFLTLNPNTGQGALVANTPLIEFVMSAMDFNPNTGELFGIEFGFGPPEEFPSYLVTINTSTAEISRIGEVPLCSDAMVFINQIPKNVPTLSEWGLIATAAILGFIGFIVIRRRKATA